MKARQGSRRPPGGFDIRCWKKFLACLAATALLVCIMALGDAAYAQDKVSEGPAAGGDTGTAAATGENTEEEAEKAAADQDEIDIARILAEKQKKIGPVRFPPGHPLDEVVNWISQQVGTNIVLAKGVDEVLPKEVSLPRMAYWKDVLNYVAELTNCEVKEVSEDLYKLIQPPKVKMMFRNADLQVVLDLLARQAGANIVISPEVQGKVTLTLNDVRWDVALDTIVKTLGFVTVREEGDIIRVVTRASLKAQLETRIFQLSYIRPPDDYRAIMTTGGGGKNGTGAGGFWHRKEVKDVDGIKMKTLEGEEYTEYFSKFALYMALREMVTLELGGRLRYDAGTNSFLVTDTRPKLDEMEKIIKQVDVAPEQIYVDVKFIRTTGNFLDEHGVRFDDEVTPEEEGIILRHRFPDATLAASASGGRVADDMISRGGEYWWDAGRWESLRSGFNMLGILDFTKTSMLLRLITSDANTRIVQAPKLLTLNHQEAVIFVGESVPFVKQEATIDQSGNVKITIAKDEDSPISVGFTLFITPHVVPGSDEIMLTVIPRTSTLIGTSSQDNPGFSRFSAQIAQGVFTYLDLPRTLEQTIVTKMLVRDGNTAVIGGLVSEDRRESVAQIPLLSAIPIIGNIFTWKRTYTQNENLIIFITPRIVRSKGQSAQLARKLVQKQLELDYFVKKYGDVNPKIKATIDEMENLGNVLTEEQERKRLERKARLEEIERYRREQEERRKEEAKRREEIEEEEEVGEIEEQPEEEEYIEETPEEEEGTEEVLPEEEETEDEGEEELSEEGTEE